MRTALSNRPALRLYPLFLQAVSSRSLGYLARNTAHTAQSNRTYLLMVCLCAPLCDQLQHCKQPQLLTSRFPEAASLPYNGHCAIPPAYPAPHGATSGFATFTQFDQSTYAHDADDPQALPLYFTRGAEFQPGAPGGVGPSAAMSYCDSVMSQAPIENWTTYHHGTNSYDGAAGPSNGTW